MTNETDTGCTLLCCLCHNISVKEPEQPFIVVGDQIFNFCSTCYHKFYHLQASHDVYKYMTDDSEDLIELRAAYDEYNEIVEQLLKEYRTNGSKMHDRIYSYEEELKENCKEAMELYRKHGFDKKNY